MNLEVIHYGNVRDPFGFSARPVRVVVGSCSDIFQILVRSCSNPIEVFLFIPSQMYETIRYRLYSSSGFSKTILDMCIVLI